MNILQILARKIIRTVFGIGINAVEAFHSRDRLRTRGSVLAKYPEGTLARDISICLERHGLRPLPRYEDHDLKHVLLEYGMTPEDEIRLQAFMIGNGNHSLAALGLFAFGALLLPDEWRSFREAYRRGTHAVPISTWSIRTHGHLQTSGLRRLISSPIPLAAAPHMRPANPLPGTHGTPRRLMPARLLLALLPIKPDPVPAKHCLG